MCMNLDPGTFFGLIPHLVKCPSHKTSVLSQPFTRYKMTAVQQNHISYISFNVGFQYVKKGRVNLIIKHINLIKQ